MASWTDLAVGTSYTTLLQQLNDRDIDAVKMGDPAFVTVTNPKTNQIRWNSANKRFETYNGSAWIELIVAATDAFAHTVTGLRGGNIYGSVTNNGTITGGAINANTLQVSGSSVWTTASLTNLNQLTNGPAFTTLAGVAALYAPLASAPLTGTPTAPTAAVDTNTTQLATTAYVIGQGYVKAATAASTYAPLGGAGTSGTWPINISGNSATTSQTTFTSLIASGTLTVSGALTSNTQVIANGNQSSAIATTSASLGGVIVSGPDNTHAAFMSFVRPGAFGAYFGLDADNKWKVGGWSMGANAYELLNANNYTSYAPSLLGAGASGTWSISISGNQSGGSVNATSITSSAGVAAAGVLKGNSGTKGFGAITTTTTTTTPTGGTDGDFVFVF